MIDKFMYGFLNRAYDLEDYTQLEINSKLIQKMDEVIENCNNAFEFMDYIKEEGLINEVINILLAWKEDGTLENLSNKEEIDNLRNEINNNISELSNSIDTKINEITNSLDTKINELKEIINQNNSELNYKCGDINE